VVRVPAGPADTAIHWHTVALGGITMTKVKHREQKKQKAASAVKLDPGHAKSPTLTPEAEGMQLMRNDSEPVSHKRQKRYGHN
jgi:hypothetical protein